MNFVDFDQKESRASLESFISAAWSGINQRTDSFADRVSYLEAKSRLDVDCSLIVNGNTCYVIFLMHKIGLANLTLFHQGLMQ